MLGVFARLFPGARPELSRLEQTERDLRASEQRLGSALEALQRSEKTARRQLAELESIYAAAPIGLCVIDTELRWLRINDRLAEMNGYPAAEHIGRSVQELLPSLAEQAASVLQRILATGEPALDIEIVGETQARPGEQRVWLESFYPLRDPSGAIIGINTVCEEVTEQKRAEAALRAATESAERSRAQLEAIIDNLTEAVLIIAPDGELVTMNPAGLALHGYDDMAQTNRALADQFGRWQILDLDGKPLPEREWPAPRVLRGERFTNYEVRVRRLGSAVEFVGSYSGTSVRDAGGNIQLAVLVIRDVSEDERTEALLAASAAAERNLAQLEAVFASINEGLAIAEPDGSLRAMNPAALRMFELERLEQARDRGRMLFDVWTLEGQPLPYHDWPLRRAARGERFTGVELRVRERASGREWIVCYAGSPVYDREGRLIAGVISFEDITDEKRIEGEREMLLDAERAARSEAERASRMKDEFLAMLSHELRTPLNAILGWSQLLQTPKRTDVYIDKGLAVIERNTRVQMQLISDLLDVSRIVSGKLTLELEPVALPVLLEGSIEACRSPAEAKQITIEDDIELIDAPSMGDPARLQQVFTNLLSNAIKFTPAGGRVRVAMAQRGGRVEISVCDTGQGIAAEFLPHLFERFRQADGSITRSHGGLGLGLSIVKHIVERHGGSVRAESPGPGMGATFTVELPLDESMMEARPEPWVVPVADRRQRETNGRLEGVRVLIVDDEADARDMARRIIEERKGVVTTVGSAPEGLAALAAEHPDLIVCDIGMPEMDGYSFARALRASEDPRSRSIPALALTAFARPEDRERALAAGFQAHLGKPVEPADLLEALIRLLESKRGGELGG